MDNHTEAQVLAHHGITARNADALTDAARDAGLIFACLGCGTVQGILADPDHARALGYTSVEAARVATRDHLDLGAEDCCDGATTIRY